MKEVSEEKVSSGENRYHISSIHFKPTTYKQVLVLKYDTQMNKNKTKQTNKTKLY